MFCVDSDLRNINANMVQQYGTFDGGRVME